MFVTVIGNQYSVICKEVMQLCSRAVAQSCRYLSHGNNLRSSEFGVPCSVLFLKIY
jgi:hypothetical protein